MFFIHPFTHTPMLRGWHARHGPARREILRVRCLAQGHFDTPRVGSNRQPSDYKQLLLWRTSKESQAGAGTGVSESELVPQYNISWSVDTISWFWGGDSYTPLGGILQVRRLKQSHLKIFVCCVINLQLRVLPLRHVD